MVTPPTNEMLPIFPVRSDSHTSCSVRNVMLLTTLAYRVEMSFCVSLVSAISSLARTYRNDLVVGIASDGGNGG